MKIQTLIEAGPEHFRAAILEDGEAVAFTVIPKAGEITGPVYLARVKKVDPKINAAFLDLGNGLEAFLPFRQAKALKKKLSTSISGLVSEGETILVKITAPATEHGKLPLATANPMLAGRYALSGHLPGKGMVAKGLEDGAKRAALEALLAERHTGDSLIIRSAAAVVDPALVEAEIGRQQLLWQDLEAGDKTPGMVLPALDPIRQLLRDFAPPGTDEILIDDKIACLNARKIASLEWPDLEGKISQFTEGPVMEAFGLEERLEYVRSGSVPLPSGGNLTLEDTRAMTVIDVNSGQARKGKAGSLALITNLEAAKALAREIRFQNLGGLITVDFIDMNKHEDRERVLEALDEALSRDPRAIEHTGINRFGLLTIKRARRGRPLKSQLEIA